jgi:hypothetical protein
VAADSAGGGSSSLVAASNNKGCCTVACSTMAVRHIAYLCKFACLIVGCVFVFSMSGDSGDCPDLYTKALVCVVIQLVLLALFALHTTVWCALGGTDFTDDWGSLDDDEVDAL